jgi:insulysin
VTPVQDLRNMSLSWTIPDYRAHTEANPVQYISHLVGHEGAGSLLSELKRRGWCNGLYAGGRREARGFQFFNITLDLSEEGGERCDEIVELVYQYLNMLKSETPAEWIFNELNNLGKISFNFKDKEKPINFVSSIVSDMHLPIRMENILTSNYYLNKFEPALIASVYEHLVPEKMRVTVLSKKYQGKTDRVEKWYGTEYKEEKIPQETLDKLSKCGLNDAFKLPR